MTRIDWLVDKVTGTVASGPPAWRQLGHARRRDVLHHVRQGRPDPDPAVWAVAVSWARWQLTVPLWRRLVRAAGIALGLYLAIGIAWLTVLPLLLLIPGGELEVQRGYWWVLRDALLLGSLTYWFGVIPRLDARRIDRLRGRNRASGRLHHCPVPLNLR